MRHSSLEGHPCSLLLGLGIALALCMATPAVAEDSWSIVLTPQIWGTHVAKNGFVAGAPNTVYFTTLGMPLAGVTPGTTEIDSSPASFFYAQGGGQIALQYGRWTLAATGQYVQFTTENDVRAATTNDGFCFAGCPTLVPPVVVLSVPPGGRVFKERVEVDRFDFDLALSYFFPEVVKDLLDVSAGVGFKFIHAGADREIVDSAGATDPNASGGAAYCTTQNCLGQTPGDRGDKTKVSSSDYLYGLTLPTSLTFQLTRNKKWLLPFNVSPFLGAEVRDDRGVVYSGTVSGTAANPTFSPKRLDGTTFAYGVTSDLNLRYVFDNGISPYVGFRVQYIKGHEEYLAWGPLAGVSFRFGAR